MRWYLFILVTLLLSCKKDNASTRIPAGVWVNKAFSLDTMVTYRENGRNILFDNSTTYRGAPSPSPGFAKWIYLLGPGKIYLKFYTQTAEDYFTWDFTWITEGQEFSISANATRPYLSSMGGKLVYERVK